MIEGLEVAALPEAEAEIRRLQDVLGHGGLAVDLLLGKDASLARVKEVLSSGKFDLIHFAGHGLTMEQDSFSPGLMLEDGVLPFELLSNFDLSNSIVFLNLCSTGNTLDHVSKVLVGAGVSAAVGFVGPLTDRGGAMLALSFYEELAMGHSLGGALLRAKRSLRMSNLQDHSWATFVLFGDPSLRVNLRNSD